jgi:hypothetical protein
VTANDGELAAPYGEQRSTAAGGRSEGGGKLFTGIHRTIVTGVVAGFATLFLAAPSWAMLPEGGKGGSHSARHLAAVAHPVVSATNKIYAIGCADGTIPGTTGGDNNNYDYYGNPCDS